MISLLQTPRGVIITGFLSIAIAVAFLFGLDGSIGELGYHLSALQIVASIILIVGAIKEKYKLLVPWLITTVFFVYLLIYVFISNTWVFFDDWSMTYLCFPILILSVVFLCCGLYAVQQAFEQMRKSEPPAYNQFADNVWKAPI